MTTTTITRERSGSTSSISSTDSQVALPSFEHIAPPRERTTEENAETSLAIPGVRDVRLKVDAGPGCGGIAWPAGEVSAFLNASRRAEPRFLLIVRTVCAPRRAALCQQSRPQKYSPDCKHGHQAMMAPHTQRKLLTDRSCPATLRTDMRLIRASSPARRCWSLVPAPVSSVSLLRCSSRRLRSGSRIRSELTSS